MFVATTTNFVLLRNITFDQIDRKLKSCGQPTRLASQLPTRLEITAS